MSRMQQRNLWIFRMMPPELTQDMSLSWNEVVYNDTGLDRAPEEAVPTLVTKQLQSYQDRLIRWNKGASIERNLYLQPKGRRDFWLSETLHAAQHVLSAHLLTLVIGCLSYRQVEQIQGTIATEQQAMCSFHVLLLTNAL